MKRTSGLLLVTTVAMLAGCGGTQEPGAAPSSPVTADVEAIPTPTPTPTPTPSASAETSQRGNIIKEIGETAWASEDPSGADPWLEFQITDIAVGGECTSDIAEPAENGQFLILSISASTGTTWPADLQGLTLDFNAYDFSIVGPDGVTESNLATDTAAYCLDEGDMVPYEIGPGENVVGKVALDTKNAEGVLVYKPWYGAGATGWEWEY